MSNRREREYTSRSDRYDDRSRHHRDEKSRNRDYRDREDRYRKRRYSHEREYEHSSLYSQDRDYESKKKRHSESPNKGETHEDNNKTPPMKRRENENGKEEEIRETNGSNTPVMSRMRDEDENNGGTPKMSRNAQEEFNEKGDETPTMERTKDKTPQIYENEGNNQKESEESVLDDSELKQILHHLKMLTPCRSVENYAKLHRVQEGTYGVVFKAKDKETGEIVALKKIKIHKENEGFPITSLREIKILTQFKHPNIVDVKEIVVGRKLDSVFIVMEYLDHDLKGLMHEMKADTRFLTSEVKCLMLQLLSAVNHLHDNWIIHRDLKSSNLLYSNRGELKVADFGLAREYGSPLRPYTHMVVTLWYRSPELLLGCREYSTAVDMWSVGCIFAELITKEPLIPGRSELDQLTKMFKLLGSPNEKIWPGFKELPNAKKINPGKQPYNNLGKKLAGLITEKGFDLLNRMLTYDPSKRITAAEALEHPWFEESPRAVDPTLMPTWPSSHEPRKKPPSPGDELKKQILGEGYTGESEKPFSLFQIKNFSSL